MSVSTDTIPTCTVVHVAEPWTGTSLGSNPPSDTLQATLGQLGTSFISPARAVPDPVPPSTLNPQPKTDIPES